MKKIIIASYKNILPKGLYISLFFSLLFAYNASAQQENHYTMFAYNKMMYNPAFAGAREVASALALYRNQWIGYQGAPQSQLLSFDTPLGKTRASIGAQLSRHTIGIERSMLGNLAYSYAIMKTKSTSLRIGLNGSVRNIAYDFLDPAVYIRDGSSNDAALNNGAGMRVTQGNFGAGAYFDYKNFYVGFSVPNMYQNKIGESNAIQQRHFYLMTGALIPLSDKIQLRPALSFRYVKNIPMSFDANLMFILMKKIHFGASYRLDSQFKTESTDFIAFFQPIGRLGVGVSYDISLNNLGGKGNSGSIEALVRYDFGDSNGVKGKFDNPRFFF